ncbi:protein kinase domain-containing protein [Streptomyces sp. 1222.5]|uniref:serine/threonine-protein kinase n=1 Tax=Streptomyces sp. 1222.5 TaxID=1881026 RepID=UPI003D739551
MRSPDPGDPPAVGGYPLLARLGAGGMGQVFLSRTPSGRPLALKTVRAEFGDDPGFEQRFAREIASSDRVRSPWTVSVVDFSPPGQRPQWLATEYVAAPSLGEWVRRHGPLPEPALRALGAELADALRAVHRAGLVHRDVKPSNVLLARHHPRLIDFGIARAVDDTRHTRTGGVIGSPGYLAPEQITGGVSAEPGDVFALGGVLVYAATGAGPFLHPGEDPSAAGLLYRVVHERPDLSAVPPALAGLLTACLHKSPADRPTAGELLDRLGGTRWADALPAGLEPELERREAELREALERPPVRPPVPGGAPAAVGGMPVATAPATSAPAGFGPPVPVPAPAGHPYPGAAPVHRSRSRAAVAGFFAVAVVAVVAAVVTHTGGGSGGDGGHRTSATPGVSGSVAALPASWYGTWKGRGPGSGAADGVLHAPTSGVSVTLTLHAAKRGELVGRQVSRISEAGTGREVGCTETLLLREVHRDSMVFEAATGKPTDPSSGVLCGRGNVYSLGMSGSGTLTLDAEGAQAEGSPKTLTRTS